MLPCLYYAPPPFSFSFVKRPLGHYAQMLEGRVPGGASLEEISDSASSACMPHLHASRTTPAQHYDHTHGTQWTGLSTFSVLGLTPLMRYRYFCAQ